MVYHSMGLPVSVENADLQSYILSAVKNIQLISFALTITSNFRALKEKIFLYLRRRKNDANEVKLI